MWFKVSAEKIDLKIWAKPNAKRTALLKIDEQGLQISFHSKPQKGAANT